MMAVTRFFLPFRGYRLADAGAEPTATEAARKALDALDRARCERTLHRVKVHIADTRWEVWVG